jgi:uncharacterized iron-regulated membrane protein
MSNTLIFRWLRFLHRYLGTAAAIFLLVLAVTGGILVFKKDIWRIQYPEFAEAVHEPNAAELANAIRQITETYPGEVTLIRMPEAGIPAYLVYLEDREALFHQHTAELIDSWAWHESVMGVIAELHYRLLGGDLAKTPVGILGLLAGFFAISGIWLWWPMKRFFKAASFWPKNLRRPQILLQHRNLGIVSAVFIMLFGLTGAGVVFGKETRNLFNMLFSGDYVTQSRPSNPTDQLVQTPDEQIIQLALSAMPDSKLRSFSPPSEGSGIYYFRFKVSGEPHPNGRSTVYIDALEGTLLQATSANILPLGVRITNWMYPLHAATVGGWVYKVLALLAAISLACMSLTGISSFIMGVKRKKSSAGINQP